MKQEYAIVDIETTGGNAAGSRITEIAILIHDGISVIERWETLVNPEQHIPAPIFALTGINNEMVANAPTFDDIAQKVFSMLDGRVFIAHSVNFDYSFVRHQLEQSGFKWTARKLCTVRAARRIKPGLRSYGLGNLCHVLDIPIHARHRAGGDADATAILFSKLLEWDTEREIDKMLKKTSHDQRLPPNVPPEDFEKLPHKPGVYYFYDQYGKVVYVGKAVNLKKRVASHFGGNNTSIRRQQFLRDIHGISFEVCATELMALLLECSEIKKLWPVYNTALKRFEPKFALFHYEARNGYQYLALGKLAKNQRCVATFHSQYEAVNALLALSRDFNLDYRFCHYGPSSQDEFPIKPEIKNLPDKKRHNRRVERAIESLQAEKPTYGIIDKGRSADEYSCIWVQDGEFYGMGYMTSDVAVSDAHTIKEYVSPYRSNPYSMQLIGAYAEKFPGKVVKSKL